MDAGDDSNIEVQELLDTIENLYGLGGSTAAPAEQLDYSAYTQTALEEQGYADMQIEEILLGVSQKLPVFEYAKTCYNWKQMQELRLGLLEGLDIRLYDNPLFLAEQMREIRLGLLDHLDVSSYAQLIHSTRDMETARQELMSAAYREHPDSYARTFTDEDSGVCIRISPDCMAAYITLPPEGDFTAAQLRSILRRNQIVFGVSDRALREAVQEADGRTEHKAASGKPATEGRDGRYEYYFNAMLPEEPRECEDGSVDYTTVTVADRRNTGDILAKYIPAEKGEDGETVTGILLQGGYGVQKPMLKGQGIQYEADTGLYRATEAGYVMLNAEDYTLNVRNVYVVEGDINRYNGHITYDGAIYVRGSVGDMAEITAAGNVVVDGYVEAARICAGENIILRGGMNGGGRGALEAGGKVVGRFFEATSICAKGDIEGNYFMNCAVRTDKSVIARGTKSKIMGGSIKAAYSVVTHAVMAYGNTATLIDIGDSGWLSGRLRQTQEALLKVRTELAQLRQGREKVDAMLGGQSSQQNTLFHKICVAIRMKEEEEEQLETEEGYHMRLVRRAANAYIKVYGRIQAGVVLTIGGKTRRLEDAVNGTITIDREHI